MDAIGRGYMLITSGSLRVKGATENISVNSFLTGSPSIVLIYIDSGNSLFLLP